MSKIDTSQNQIPIWLVWSLATSGNKLLNAICLERERANSYRKALSNESRYVRVWVEPCEANHLYAGLFEIPSDESIRSLVSQLAAAQHGVQATLPVTLSQPPVNISWLVVDFFLLISFAKF